MNKKIIYIIIGLIIVLIAMGAWVYVQKMNQKTSLVENNQEIQLKDDTTDSINQALDEIKIDDVDNNLNEVNSEINKL